MDPILFGIPILLLASMVYYMSLIQWVLWVAGIALVVLLTEVLKSFVQNPRPQGACKCDIWEHTGDASGAPGFPSGHAAASTFLVAYLYGLTRAPSVLLFGVPWMIWVAISRLQKYCHTVPQVVAGMLLGFGFAVGFVCVAD